MPYDPNLLNPAPEPDAQKARNRRASESHKYHGKKNDLKCTTCGKVYKHSSCLTKHKWEHTPEWALTSKLQISKHQQVQLLEAASVLCSIRDHNGTEYASSDMSAVSDINEEPSSPETTPERDENRHRFSSTTSDTVFSQSYNSVSDHYTKPTTSGTDVTDNDFSKSYEHESSYGVRPILDFHRFEPNSADTLRGQNSSHKHSRNKSVDSEDEMEGIESQPIRSHSNSEEFGVFGHME